MRAEPSPILLSLLLRLKNNYLLWIALWLAAFVIFSYSWLPGGLDIDSCNYAVVSEEILRTHQWLKLCDPVIEQTFYYHFPLHIWITAFLFKLFGVSTFTAKFFAMFSGVALTGVIFYLGRMLKNKWAGFFGALSFLMTNHVVRLSRECRMDIPVSLFIALAVFAFILAQRKGRAYYLLFGLFTCLAIMVKDVVGLAPLAIVFIYLIVTLRWRELFQPLFIAGALVAVLPVLGWIWLDQGALFKPWFNCNFMHLYKAARFNVPWYYYIWALATKYFYLLPFTIYGGYIAFKKARKTPEYYLLIIWAVFFPFVFSFARQKLHYFILPMYPATAVLNGLCFNRIFKEPFKPKIVTGLKYILIFGSIIMLCFPLNIRSKRFRETVTLAPSIDEILKQAGEYEFIAYKQDGASLLFYSRQLKRLTRMKNIEELDGALVSPDAGLKFCYLTENDFKSLSPRAVRNCQIILRHKDRLVIVNKKDAGIKAILP